jgi:hypothetical protein
MSDIRRWFKMERYRGAGFRVVTAVLGLILGLVVGAAAASAAATRDYAVEVSATAEEAPPRIDFAWRADATATEYRVFRKAVVDTAWGDPIAVLPGTATSFSDDEVTVGEAYEYSFQKTRGIISDTVAVASGSAVAFSIYDSWGDGICCVYSLGSYKVSGCGVAYASGGAFRTSETTSFVVGSPENPCSLLVVDITLDIFGSETTWDLTDTATGDTLAQGGPYSSPKFGHILAGIRYAAPESLGTVLLLVDDAVASPLSGEIARLELDMIRDGYRVERRTVAADATVAEVKNLIVSECQNDATISTLFLLGSIAIPYSGDMRGAHANEFGAWAADTYYGELNGIWTDSVVNNTRAARIENHNVPGDGKFDQTYLPSALELQVGRVDLSNLPAFPDGEIELLRRYLNKDHGYRSGEIVVPRRGLIKDGTGEMSGAAYACTGWRNYTAMFGESAVHIGQWLPALQTNPYLCAFGSGAGSFTSCGTVISTNDYVTKTIYAVFQMLMGSYFGEWDATNNLMRASLASAGYGLACFWAGHPAWHLHHMALGYPIGYSARLTQNDHTLYMIGYGGMQTSIALMGDPTIRLHVVKPPTDLGLECIGGGSIGLAWRPPADSVLGYHMYRAQNAREAFTRIDTGLLQDTTFVDTSPLPGSNAYMVRAVKIETTGSGTYLNLSPGVLDSIDVVAGVDADETDREVSVGDHLGLASRPNPFEAGVAIEFYLPEPDEVAVWIHDAAGRLVRSLDLGRRGPGRHVSGWDGRDSHGRQVASGVYYLSVTAGRARLSAKLVRIE